MNCPDTAKMEVVDFEENTWVYVILQLVCFTEAKGLKSHTAFLICAKIKLRIYIVTFFGPSVQREVGVMLALCRTLMDCRYFNIKIQYMFW